MEAQQELLSIESRPTVEIQTEYMAAAARVGYDARGNWRIFSKYLEDLRTEIRLWHLDYVKHDSLTALCWSLANRIYNRGDGLQLMDFVEHKQRCYLRNGLIELAKILCREVEAYEKRFKHAGDDESDDTDPD